jgi:hypothetical protein
VAEPVTPETAPSTADDYSGIAGTLTGAGQDRVVVREAIARRAYEIYTARGGTDGYDIEDWLQAERELSGR